MAHNISETRLYKTKSSRAILAHQRMIRLKQVGARATKHVGLLLVVRVVVLTAR